MARPVPAAAPVTTATRPSTSHHTTRWTCGGRDARIEPVRERLEGVRDDAPRAARGGLARRVGEVVAGGLADHVGGDDVTGVHGVLLPGVGPVDARTTSSVGNCTAAGPSASSRRRTASEPLSSWGWRTVVSGGSAVAAAGTSSNPATDELRGAPRCRASGRRRGRRARSRRTGRGSRWAGRRGRAARRPPRGRLDAAALGPSRRGRSPSRRPRSRAPRASRRAARSSTLRVAAACAAGAVGALAVRQHEAEVAMTRARAGARPCGERRRGRRC